MSHISLYEAQERRNNVFNTPLPKHRGQNVRDFIGRGAATPSTRNYKLLATPGTRRIDTAPDLVAEIEQDEHLEYKNLCGRVWKTYSVSPLFNFNQKTSLESLKRKLENQIDVQSYINPNTEVTYHVTIEKGLRGNREDSECLKIQILKSNNMQLCALYFLAVHSQESQLRSTVTNLPLCLTWGPEKLIQEILLIMERKFDSVIYPLRFEPIDLKWMVALWSGVNVENDENDGSNIKHDSVKLRFELPLELQNKGLDHIDAKFSGEQIRGFWEKFKCDNEMEMSLEEMDRFHEIIQNFLKDCFKFQFDKLTLTNIVLPTLSAASNGNVKINRVDKIKTVLGFLTSLCQEKYVLMADPGLGVPIDMM